jgi:hypothetical protein
MSLNEYVATGLTPRTLADDARSSFYHFGNNKVWAALDGLLLLPYSFACLCVFVCVDLSLVLVSPCDAPLL